MVSCKGVHRKTPELRIINVYFFRFISYNYRITSFENFTKFNPSYFFSFSSSELFARINNGELAEWSNAVVLKTIEASRFPEVRILYSPPQRKISHYEGFFFFFVRRHLTLS